MDFTGAYFVVLNDVCIALHDCHQCTGFILGNIGRLHLGSFDLGYY